MIRTSILTIGENKSTPRIWIEGRFLKMAGFESGKRVRTQYGDDEIVLILADDGDRVVSSHRGSPVIDCQNTEIRSAIKTAAKIEVNVAYGEITIAPAITEIRKATRSHNRSAGSVFSGGGLLDEAARRAGYRSVFAIEIDPKYADVWQANHEGHMLCGCISEVGIRRLPQVDLLTLGIPCEPFSQKRRNAGNQKRESRGPVDHDLADMSFWALMVVDQCNPSISIIENVPKYLESEIGIVTMAAMRRMGYNVESRVINGNEYGALTTRKRAVIIAKDGPIRWPKAIDHPCCLSSILHHPDDPRCEWFHRSDSNKRWLFDHWEKQTAKGNGFASQQLTPDTPAVQAISKRYFAGQGDAPVVRDVRPGREDWFRWLSLSEVKAIMGVPEAYDLGNTKTFAGEILGQGVLVEVFRQIIEANMSGRC